MKEPNCIANAYQRILSWLIKNESLDKMLHIMANIIVIVPLKKDTRNKM